MANCSDGCTCVILAGDGVVITGAGTVNSPLMVSATSPLAGALSVSDTSTINLSLSGDGTIASPMVLSGIATVAMQTLTDVNDPGGPSVGDVPVWDAGGYFVFAPPPANPPGAVNVGAGLDGDGSAGAPLVPALVGTSAGGTTSGLEVYVDSAGDLRAVPPPSTTVAWNDITGKPTQFPPSAHTHTANQITDPLNLSVGDSVRVSGHQVFVQSTAPTTGMVAGDLWFW